MSDGMLDASNTTPDTQPEINPNVVKLNSFKEVANLMAGLLEQNPHLAEHLHPYVNMAAGNVISAISSVPLDALTENERLEELARQARNIAFWEAEVVYMEKRLDTLNSAHPDRYPITHNMSNRLNSLYEMVNKFGIEVLREYSKRLRENIKSENDEMTVTFLNKAIDRAEKRSREN